jgi:hypothetical protein
MVLLSISSAHADSVGHMTAAITEAKPILDLRLRSESVSQDGVAERAEALTLRGRVGVESGKVWSSALLAEGEFLWPWVSRYDSTVNANRRYPIVADPEDHKLNRLQLTNTTLPGTTLVVGRQRIVLDDQRFLANVGWRQHEQTYDALRVTSKLSSALTLDVAWIDQVNRVFGTDSPVGRYHGDSYATNVSYHMPAGTLTAFSYLLDFREAPTESSATHGLRFAGSHSVQDIKLGYSASFAHQTDRGRNPLDYGASYSALELSGAVREFTLTAGVERLEGTGVKGFTTPLATLHKFQGWADKFLTTPPDGVVDQYANLGWTTKRVAPLDSFAALVSIHRFDAQRTSVNYGSEADLQLEGQYGRVRATLKYAGYDSTHFATDTTKYWAQIEFVL